MRFLVIKSRFKSLPVWILYLEKILNMLVSDWMQAHVQHQELRQKTNSEPKLGFLIMKREDDLSPDHGDLGTCSQNLWILAEASFDVCCVHQDVSYSFALPHRTPPANEIYGKKNSRKKHIIFLDNKAKKKINICASAVAEIKHASPARKE